MSYPPNIRAARWFADECFPLIQAEVPGATFVIAGAAPAREIRELQTRNGIVVTGFVPSMPVTLNAATVAVAPMRSGAGIQNKILEAMACGLPVVTTTIGLGGITATRGRELLVADRAHEIRRRRRFAPRRTRHAREPGRGRPGAGAPDVHVGEAASAVERVTSA